MQNENYKNNIIVHVQRCNNNNVIIGDVIMIVILRLLHMRYKNRQTYSCEPLRHNIVIIMVR